MIETAYLVLTDGLCFPGSAFGAPAPTPGELDPQTEPLKSVGEVVFNTAMSGYLEVLTDPSYTGQLVVMTYPHIGNYGVLDEWSETGPEGETPRDVVKAAGFVLRSLYRGPVPEGRIALDDYLKRHNTPGITGVDTRRLTLRLRDQGSANGVVVRANGRGVRAADAHRPGPVDELLDAEDARRIRSFLAGFPVMEGRNLIGGVGTPSPLVLNAEGSPHIALIDCGSKANILREVLSRGCRVSLFPSGTTAEAVRKVAPDAVLVSNGPGDPAVLHDVVATLRDLVGTLPLFGICLGHQLISEALGAKTFKMGFGHHGVNHPVRDELSRKVFVTSQNHGFAVDEKTLPPGTDVWFRNANDGTVEGIVNRELAIWTAQFHPESAPGPHDARWIFDRFLKESRAE